MRSTARIWPNLTQIALSVALWSGCGTSELPLEADPHWSSQGKLPVEFAGSGSGGFGGWGGVMPAEAICGDTVIVPPVESCDRTNLNGATCRSLGYNGGGQLLCNPTTCTYDTIFCRMDAVVPPTTTPITPPPPTRPVTPPPPRKPDVSGEDAGIDDAGQ